MVKRNNWDEAYWLLLMQLYLKQPLGVKPLYSRQMIDLALETHVPPQSLYRRMLQLRRLDTPRIQRLWQKYSNSPAKLRKGVKMLRTMAGFNNADTFFDGVDMNTTFEPQFLPIKGAEPLTPLMLIIILDEYFRLTPVTMNADTPEVKKLAKMMNVDIQQVVEALETFQYCDPYLRRTLPANAMLTQACQEVWQKYGNDNPDRLMAEAALMKVYFKK